MTCLFGFLGTPFLLSPVDYLLPTEKDSAITSDLQLWELVNETRDIFERYGTLPQLTHNSTPLTSQGTQLNPTHDIPYTPTQLPIHKNVPVHDRRGVYKAYR